MIVALLNIAESTYSTNGRRIRTQNSGITSTEVLLEDLRKRGKAIIAISHDDRYFHCADQVITLEYGQIRSLERPHGDLPRSAAPTNPPA